jgi:hypothetical protein
VETWLSGFDAASGSVAAPPAIKFANELVRQTFAGRYLLK